MTVFVQNLSKLMPEWVALPPELTQTFDWLEDQGWLVTRGTALPEEHTLMVYPAEFRLHPVTSHLAFGGTTLAFTDHWPTPDPAIDNRIAEIAETAGDGGRVAIWRDSAGKQRFVHIGHNTVGTITDDPLVLLQFLAMGYPEAGAMERLDITPMQAFLEYHGVATLQDFGAEEQPLLPHAFQGFLKQQFNLDMPRTARDLGIADFAPYGTEGSADEFVQWVTDIQPKPTEADLAYEHELMRTVESLGFRDDDDSDTIMKKFATLFENKEK